MRNVFLTYLTLCMSIGWSYAQPGLRVTPRTVDHFGQLDQAIPLAQQPQLLESYLSTSKGYGFTPIQLDTDELGMQHERLQEYYQGIPVEGAVFILHSTDGLITHQSGSYLELRDLSTTPALDKNQALEQALAHTSGTQYAWQERDERGKRLAEKPVGELVILPDWNHGKQPRLAYKFDIYTLEPLYRANVFVDAQTGEILDEHPRLHDADVSATGNSLYNGTVSFTADSYSGGYRLRQGANGNGIETYDLNNSTNYNNASDISSSSTSFGNTNRTGVQAHWGAEQTHDYFLNSHSRNSFDGNGAVIRSYVSYSSNYVNAFWDGSRMTYGDGDGVNYGPLVSLDIVGHEITHGVTEYAANLVYSYESGALNESFSDIFGEAIERHATGSNDWQMGTDMGIGQSGAIRSMDNPNAYGDPDTYGGTNWYTGSGDNGGVHINSGVQNKWFYILTEGESGTNDLGNSYSVTGIGIDKAAAIAYRNLSVYLSVNSQYSDARAGAIQSAIDLYGAGSAEEIATTNAWYAVGVGGEYGTISYCSSGGNNSSYEWIASVSIGSYTNNSGAAGYSDFTGQTVSLTAGQSASVSLTPGFSGTVYNEYWKIWIDYNGDGDFSDAGEEVYTSGGLSSSTVTGSFNVPSSAAGTTTRMRVSMKYNAAQTACETFTYGEVEDYTVDISGGSGGGDTQAPSVPTGLSASNIQETSATVSWSASSDNVGVTGYNVYIGGSNIGSVTGTSANITGLTASTTYTVTVAAFDAAGNTSAQSSGVTFTTSAAPDTEAPTVPSGLASSNVSPSSFDVSWSASSDNVGVSSYSVYLDGSFAGNTSGTSYSFSGLSASTTYSVTVSASDAAGNSSAQSSALSVTTQTGGGGGNTTISASFFETGWDDWNDGGSDCARRIDAGYAPEGSYSIRIRDNTNSSVMTTDPLNLAGYSAIEIEFYFIMRGMDSGEDFWLQYNDGSGFTTVASWSRANHSNNTNYVSTVTLSSADYNLVNGGTFRFRNDASVNNDRTYIDAVTITGISSSFAPTAFSVVEIGPSGVITEQLEEEAGAFLHVYPNPTHGVLHFETEEVISLVRVFSATGQQVLTVESPESELDMSSLPKGIYFLTATTEEGEILRQKFLKQ